MGDLFSVEGKTAVVTGGSRGIGLMIARGFVEGGARVYVSSRKAAVRPRRTTKLLSPWNVRAPSGDRVAPSIAPARRAAMRACSSGSVRSDSALRYGRPGLRSVA